MKSPPPKKCHVAILLSLFTVLHIDHLILLQKNLQRTHNDSVINTYMNSPDQSLKTRKDGAISSTETVFTILYG